LGNAEAWAARIAQGIDVLKDHAINGYQGSAGFMPAKGGRTDLSDEEVASAVDYMVSESQ
jgi:cytochrome c5